MDASSFIELSDLQYEIKNRIEPLDCWVRVEIESHRIVNGHHYLGLIQKSSGGDIVAKAGAHIWKSRSFIIDDFTSITGKELCAGLSVVMEVSVDYHAQYGLALNVLEIDANYSIGQRELEKKATVKKLTDSGLIDLQKKLELPYLPSSIAVISSRDAAGFGDFTKHLNENPSGFTFNVTLFQSLVQGVNAPGSIIGSLDEIKRDGGFNVVLILRGGGADSDMYCFDDCALCEAIAQFPIPVLTAIGHDRDYHIADMVAHSHFKTPTALADCLIEWTSGVEKEMFDALSGAQSAMEERLAQEDTLITAAFNNVKYHLSGRIDRMASDIQRTVSTIQFALIMILNGMDNKVAIIDTDIKSSDPRGILLQGYVLATDKNGTILKNARSKAVGDDFSVRFKDGLWNCSIDEIKFNE